MKHRFIDAQVMHKKFPGFFRVPGKKELDGLSIGDKVKVCAYAERFWVKVSNVSGNKITGTAIAGLAITDKIKKGDKLVFEKKHIYNIQVYS